MCGKDRGLSATGLPPPHPRVVPWRDDGRLLARRGVSKTRSSRRVDHAPLLPAQGLAASTCHTVRAVLSRGFADALDDDLIAVDPTIRKVRRRESSGPMPKRFTVWTGDELKQLLDVSPDDRLGALWRLAVASGARRGELLGVT